MSPNTQPSSRSAATVLLVEDQDDVRSFVQELLELNGLTVLAAANPSEALSICRQHASSIDLLLTDVVMPQMSGPQLAGQILQIHPEAKLLYMSGYTDHPAVKTDSGQIGRVFLQKPFSPDTLTSAVQKVLADTDSN